MNETNAEHDKSCSIFRGGNCDCVASIPRGTPETDAATHDDWSGGAEATEPEVSRRLEIERNQQSARIAELETGEQILWNQLAERDEVNAQLRAQLAEREEDRALLDWLDKHGYDSTLGEWSVQQELDDGTLADDLRAAIRAARAQPEDGK